MPSKGQAELDADRALIAEAEANGFMACLAIRNALGWDKPKANGSYYSSMQTAYRWLRDAGRKWCTCCQRTASATTSTVAG